MKLPSFALAAALALGAPAGVRGCPYDLLAMCCVKINASGHCTQWKNCCSLTVDSGEGDNNGSGAQNNPNFGYATLADVELIADARCVQGCSSCSDGEDDPEEPPDRDPEGRRRKLPHFQNWNGGIYYPLGPYPDELGIGIGETPSYASLSACYESCAVPPDDGGGCISFSSSKTGFEENDKCCTKTEEVGRLEEVKCVEWNDCQLVARRPTTLKSYLPFASGICIEENCINGDASSTVRGQGQGGRALTSAECYSRCSGVENPDTYNNNFEGPFGLQAPCLEIPTLFGHADAYVPMTHVSNGLDSSTHGLATESGNLNMNLKVGMCCDGDEDVAIKVFPLGDGPYEGGGPSPYSDTISVKPFSLEDLNDACEEALGGPWVSPGSHKNSEQTVLVEIEKELTIEGKCGTDANPTTRKYMVSLHITCHDLAFFVPEG